MDDADRRTTRAGCKEPALRDCADTQKLALDSRVFKSLCAYLGVLVISGLCALLSEGTVLASFIELDNFYILTVIIESIFGIFFFPFAIHPAPDVRGFLVDYVILFFAAVPFVIVGAFAAATPWHAVIFSQLLVFGIWLIAAWTREFLETRIRAGLFYLPLSALLFFGILGAGRILMSFSGIGDDISAFSVPGVLVSWSNSRYFDSNGWLGVAACLGALVLWSRRAMVRAGR